jgi:hypothetical protein
MSAKLILASVAIAFNTVSVICLASLAGFPDASLWIRNTLFVRPRTLSELEHEVAKPPKRLLSSSRDATPDSLLVARIRELCRSEASDCAPRSLAVHLASQERRGGCGTFATQSDLVEGVLAGGGCCSDVVKTFLLLAPELGFVAREVHIPTHTTAEVWNEGSRRWIWIDPYIGYQAFGNEQPLSHIDIYKRFAKGEPVQFTLIESSLSDDIRPVPDYDVYLPTAYNAIFYTPVGSLEQSAAFGDLLRGAALPKPVRELLLYVTVKPPLLASASGFSLFLLLIARYALLAWLFAWLSSSLLLILLSFRLCNLRMLTGKRI